MGKVVADMSMSLDGFVADRSDGVEHLFGWYGDLSEASAARLQDAMTRVGALVCGRRTFDLTDGWGGNHPVGVPVFVVSHSVPDGWPRGDASITFVSDGVEAALAQAKATAGDKVVGIASPSIARQCLAAGLLDEIEVSIVPVLLGEGVPLTGSLDGAPVELEGPRVIEGNGVTHLAYRVRYAGASTATTGSADAHVRA